MPDFSLAHQPGYSQAVGLAGTVTSGTPANTKGTIVQLVASTAFAATGLLIVVGQGSAADRSHLFDVYVGGSGSEVPILENLLLASHQRGTTYIHVPCNIPAGSRISAACQASTAASSTQVRVMLLRGGLLGPSGGRVITLGAVTADSGGTEIDSGATANTYGAWTQITAATTVGIAALQLRLGYGTNTGALFDAAIGNFLDIGVGSSGNEVAIVDGFPWATSGSVQTIGGGGPNIWLPASIPAGSRVSVRARNNTADATDRKFDIVLYGLAA